MDRYLVCGWTVARRYGWAIVDIWFVLEGLIRFGEAGVGGFVGVSYNFFMKIRFGDSNGNAFMQLL